MDSFVDIRYETRDLVYNVLKSISCI